MLSLARRLTNRFFSAGSLSLEPYPDNNASLAQARDLLARSQRVAAFSGAGLSAESGLATFRDPDPDALWSRFDPTDLASVDGFEAHPERVIEWYNWRRSVLAGVRPNAAHLALAAQSRLIQVTQNVDNLLEQAGEHDWTVKVVDRDLAVAEERIAGHERGRAAAFQADDATGHRCLLLELRAIHCLVGSASHIDGPDEILRRL